MTFPIVVADDVAVELGAEAAMVRTGEYLSSPQYECLKCRKPGDIRREKAAAVLFLTADTAMLNLIHDDCGPSAIYPIAELETRFGRADDPEPGTSRSPVPDATAASVVELDGVVYPMLTITPGDNVRAFAPGSTTAVDSAIEGLRAEGFGPVDLSGVQRPVELDRWSLRLEHGQLAEIRKPGGTWWSSTPPMTLPLQFRDAARKTRRCLVMVVGSAMPEDDLAALRAAMSAAAAAGGLVGALLPIRGTFS